jgi:nicotinic acid mononucleotide adenylyltransferase
VAYEEIAATLEALDAEPQPVAKRFDPGGPFSARVAVLPSAYNPPTVAHIRLLDAGREAAGADSAAALLTTRNVAKGILGASLPQRVEMLLAVHFERPEIAVVACNAARIVDQGLALRRGYPGIEFDFVMGYDTLVRLFDPQYYSDMRAELQPFFARHRVVGTNRAEAGIEEVARFIQSEAGEFEARIIVAEIDGHPAGLSSSAARADVIGGSALEAVPAAVHDYIVAHRLYH